MIHWIQHLVNSFYEHIRAVLVQPDFSPVRFAYKWKCGSWRDSERAPTQITTQGSQLAAYKQKEHTGEKELDMCRKKQVNRKALTFVGLMAVGC